MCTFAPDLSFGGESLACDGELSEVWSCTRMRLVRDAGDDGA